MKTYMVEFQHQDRKARGLHFKNAKRTVRAESEEDAIKKIERALAERVINPKPIEITEKIRKA